ncbi:whirly transcription factor-domain-containing protein [Haematococcus lacustris]
MLSSRASSGCIAANAGCFTTTQPAMRAGAMRAVMHRLSARQQDARTLARVAYGTAQDVQMGQEKCFADFAIYKGKGAVQMKPVPPSWSRTDGPRGTKLVLSREGVLMMEFANVMQGQGSQMSYSTRSYDWNNKVIIALKALELAKLSDYDLTGRPSDAGVEFFHDSGKSNAAQAGITKRLKLIYGQDLSSMLLTVTQSNAQENKNTQVTVPITRAEFVVIKALANHLIPRLLGFDVVLSDSFAS